MKIIYHVYKSSVGDLKIASHNNKLVMCDWLHRDKRNTIDNRLERIIGDKLEEGNTPIISQTINQLEEYLDNKRTKFEIPIKMVGTDFQKSVWKALIEVPYGNTATYKDLAKSIGNEKAVRAVANANGANSISIIIPCHRIIGTNGSLTGYAGGIKTKQKLLKVEYYSQTT